MATIFVMCAVLFFCGETSDQRSMGAIGLALCVFEIMFGRQISDWIKTTSLGVAISRHASRLFKLEKK